MTGNRVRPTITPLLGGRMWKYATDEERRFAKAEALKRYRARNRDRVRLRNRLRMRKNREKNPEAQRKYAREWRKRNLERARLRDKRYRDTNPEKTRLQRNVKWAVSQAVRRGILRKPTRCQWCNKKRKLQAHHPNYSKPLTVIWLCAFCHMSHHHRIED